MSPEQIREALAHFPSDELPDDPTATDHDVYGVIVGAARAYADLLDRGEIRQWHTPMVFQVPGEPHLSTEFPPGRYIIAALPVGEDNK